MVLRFFLTVFLLCCCAVPLLADNAADTQARKTLDKWAKKAGKPYGLELVTSGIGAIIDENKVKWCLSLMSRQGVRVEQVRPIVTAFAQQMNDLINQDPLFLKSVNDLHKDYNRPPESKLTPEYVGFKITFWDANMDRYQQPFVAQAIYNGNKITYLFADPQTQKLVNPIEETFTYTPSPAPPRPNPRRSR